MHNKKHLTGIISALIALMISVGAHAEQEAETVVEELISKTTSFISKNKDLVESDPDTVFNGLRQLMEETVDLERISRLITGRYWRQADPEQQKRFVADFTKLLLHNYGHLLLRYTGEDINIHRSTSLGRRGQEVQTSILWDGVRVKVDYAVAKSKKVDRWMVYDVRVDGISLVSTFRSSMQQILNTKGFDGLIASLNRNTGS